MKSKDYLKLLRSKDILAYFLILIFMLCGILYAGMQCVLAYTHANEIEQEKAKMEHLVLECQNKSKILNEAVARPVASNEVDKIQTNLIFDLKAQQLELISLQSGQVKDKEKNHFITYTMEFVGPFANAMSYIQRMNSTRNLIAITFVELTAKQENLQVKMTYRIYTK